MCNVVVLEPLKISVINKPRKIRELGVRVSCLWIPTWFQFLWLPGDNGKEEYKGNGFLHFFNLKGTNKCYSRTFLVQYNITSHREVTYRSTLTAGIIDEQA